MNLEPKDNGESIWMIIPLWFITFTSLVIALHLKEISETLLNIYLQINP